MPLPRRFPRRALCFADPLRTAPGLLFRGREAVSVNSHGPTPRTRAGRKSTPSAAVPPVAARYATLDGLPLGNYRESLLGPPFRPPSVGPSSNLLCAWGNAFFHASCHRELIKRGIAGMLIIKVLVVGSALMLLTSCAGYLTNYQTPCVQGHVCDCVQYTTVNRSWLDCRDYGRVKSKAY